MKKITKVLMSFMLVCLLVVTQAYQCVNATGGKVSILFTNDVHGQLVGEFDKDNPEKLKKIGYSEVAGLEEYLKNAGQEVVLVDAGDAIQGSADVALSKGEVAHRIMNQMGYDFLVPGNHEFDYGMDHFLTLAKDGDGYKYYSSNFMDLRADKTVFDSYKMIDTNIGKIALVGITTPEAYTKSTPKYFQDDNGNYIYGLCEGNNGKDLYDAVQTAVNSAREDDADYVIAVGHTGIDKQSSPWTSKEIIANTTGIDVFIDGHSHSTIDGETIMNKDNKAVKLAQTGTKLSTVGQLELTETENGITADVHLVSADDFNEKGIKANEAVKKFIDAEMVEINKIKNKVIGQSEIDLIAVDEDGKKVARTTPTNLGDLSADAYRYIMGADIAFMNGGGIRANLDKGDVTLGDLINVFPFNNSGTLIEVTGQQILDALEMSLSVWPEENGGYLQTSGLTYEFHSYLDSKVVKDDKKVFVKVDGEYRVKNVKVNGEPLDLNKTYKLASHDYMLKGCGDGYSMFEGSKILKDATIVDNELLIQYFQENLKGVITEAQYGKVRESRILVEKAPVVPEKPAPEKPANRPDTSDPYQMYMYGAMAIAAYGVISRRRKEN